MPIRSPALLALVFVLIFALQVAAVLLPWQPLDPAWQWRLTTTLINAAPLPLVALALLQVAVVFDPEDPLLEQRHRLFRQLTVAAALGFLLLLPLQFSAGLRQQNTAANAQRNRISGAEKRLAALPKVTAEARSNAELNAGLQTLQGPVLGPADLAHPRPLLKQQVNAVFDQAQIQINRDRAALPPSTSTTALSELLRNSLASLLLATAFAAFARRAGSDLSLLEEMRLRLLRLNPIRPRRAGALSEADDIRRLHGEQEEGCRQSNTALQPPTQRTPSP